MDHPIQTDLIEFLYGELTPERKAEVAQHVAHCPSCGAAVAQWRDVRRELQTWKLPDRPTSVRAAARPALRRMLTWAVAASLLVATGFGLSHLTSGSVANVAQFRNEIAQQVRDDLTKEFAAKWTQLAADEAARRKELSETLFKRIDEFERLRLAEFTGLREDVETVAIRTQEEFDRLANATFLRPKPDMSPERPRLPTKE
jgi:putative zinc finger protein